MALTPEQVRRLYDRLSPLYGLVEALEAGSRRRALAALAPGPGERVLAVGAGTGRELVPLVRAVGPTGRVVDLDLSRAMLLRARRRSGAPAVQGSAAALPFPDGAFDALLCAYVLDLIPGEALPRVLAEFRRVLAPGGRAVLMTMGEGTTPLSRAFLAAWDWVYARAPQLCGGCRPLDPAPLAEGAGLRVERREALATGGFPSLLVVARREAS